MPRKEVAALVLLAVARAPRPAPSAAAREVSCPESGAASTGPEQRLRFAHALRREGRLELARACYAQLTAWRPGFPDGWFELGLIEQDLGDLRAAIAAFEEGLRLRPGVAVRLDQYGVALQLMGRADEARAAYGRAIAAAPEEASAYFNLGTLEEAAGRMDASLASYRAALSAEPDDEARVHNNLGGVLLAQGDVAGATGAFESAVEADPGLADGWYNLGNARFAVGRHREAERVLIKALRLAPLHPRAGRKLEQVRAAGAAPTQRDHDAQLRLDAAQRAVDHCTAWAGGGVDGEGEAAAEGGAGAEAAEGEGEGAAAAACVQAREAEHRARTDADGPIFV